jgi:hypothetical protein
MQASSLRTARGVKVLQRRTGCDNMLEPQGINAAQAGIAAKH